jgi:uncharacterized repeat protein (TIGR03803 family)
MHKLLVVACLLASCLPVLSASGSVVFTNLFSFSGTNGIEPEGTLVQAPNGDLYGTTRETTATSGGNWGFGAYGHGTVFRITTNGVLTTIAHFTSTNANGAYPRAGLIFGRDGNLYGTTTGGGASGLGTVFRVTPTGGLTILASFGGTNGSAPISALLEGGSNVFYGTTFSGGLRKSPVEVVAGLADCGTIFTIASSGHLKPLLFFDGTNGANPRTGLIRGKDGISYGTTSFGGPDKMPPTEYTRGGFGTVFKLSADGTLSTLVTFNGYNGKGCNAVQQNADGTLYGISPDGGATNTANPYEEYSWQPFSGSGTIFRISAIGTVETLVLFRGPNGSNPASLTLGKDGSLYGTTAGGGAHNFGTIFRLEPNGKFTTLYSFTEDSGSFPSPFSSLVQGADGNLYGTTSRRGRFKCGSIFCLALTSVTPRASHH